MDLLPGLGLGLWNGWLFLVAYFLGLLLSVLTYPAAKRKKLFLKPHYPLGHRRWYVITLGQVAAICFCVLTLFAPLQIYSARIVVGLLVYVCGYCLVIFSLQDFRRAPLDEIATIGLYRFSRNPQVLGLYLVFLGTALALGAGVYLLLVLILIVTYHYRILLEEEVCLATYGAAYEEYQQQVPRYLVY